MIQQEAMSINETQEFPPEHDEELYCEGDIAQRGWGVLFHRDTQNLHGCNPVSPALGEPASRRLE